MSWIDIARVWWELGYTVLPVAADGTKRPAMPWGDYKIDRPGLQTIEWMFTRYKTDGLGVVCGSASGGLEMIEFEGRAVQDRLPAKLQTIFQTYGNGDLWETINRYAETTPMGGIHLYYRVIGGKAHGNTKLARNVEHEVLIETRGQGGFSVIAPSGGRTHPTGAEWMVIRGTPADIPTITGEQRDLVYEFARQLDTSPEIVNTESIMNGVGLEGGDRPGDDYNARASWQETLPGWEPRKIAEGYLGWRRPGKQHAGISATTGRGGRDCLYVFSTSTPFDPERPYSKFGAYALLNHGGDHGAAARALRQRGYGARPSINLAPLTITRPSYVPSDADDSVTGSELLQVEDPHAEPGPELVIDSFWRQREVFTTIRLWAEVRMVSPWALLGSIMLRCLAIVPPWVTLPPVVGGPGSLNSFLAVVGPSGAGKGASESVADECLRTDESIYQVNVGSGEGIVHQYVHRDRKTGEQVVDRTAVLFRCPEVDMLSSLDARRGSILSSVLRNAFSGDQLGQAYVETIKRLCLAPHSYRLVLNLGVQPRRAGPLLAEEAGGTPQRLWWMSAIDATVIGIPLVEKPDVITLSRHVWTRGSLTIPTEVRDEIVATRLRQIRGEVDAIDGQRMFTREKAAYALTILDDRQVMTLEDWELAGDFLAESDRVRQAVIDELASMGQEEVGKRVQARVLTERVVDEDRAARLHRAMRDRLLARIRAAGTIRWSELRRTVPGRDRDRFHDAVVDLAAEGLIAIEQHERVGQAGLRRYRYKVIKIPDQL